jgi:hypothetical protein
MDLTRPVRLDRSFDLVVCLEVGEPVDPEHIRDAQVPERRKPRAQTAANIHDTLWVKQINNERRDNVSGRLCCVQPLASARR